MDDGQKGKDGPSQVDVSSWEMESGDGQVVETKAALREGLCMVLGTGGVVGPLCVLSGPLWSSPTPLPASLPTQVRAESSFRRVFDIFERPDSSSPTPLPARLPTQVRTERSFRRIFEAFEDGRERGENAEDGAPWSSGARGTRAKGGENCSAVAVVGTFSAGGRGGGGAWIARWIRG